MDNININFDFDTTPPCPACGGALAEHDHREPEDLDGWWGHYDCTSCGWELPDQQQRLTYWTAPWTRPLVHMIVQRTQERDDARRMLGECYLDRIQAIANLVLDLGEVQRATLHADGESDATHTVLLALVHDLVEAYAGDTNTVRGLIEEVIASAPNRTAEEKVEAIKRLVASFLGSEVSRG